MLLNQRPEIYLANNEHRRNYPNLTDITSPMPVEFRIFYVRYNSKMQLDLDIYNKVKICNKKIEKHILKTINFRRSYTLDCAFHNHAQMKTVLPWEI